MTVMAQRMWQLAINGNVETIQRKPDSEWPTTPVLVLPATQDSYDAMVEQAARGMYANERRHEPHKMKWETTWEAVRNGYRKGARAALKAIGITKARRTVMRT